MANAPGIETPANKIATAQAVLSLTFRLYAEVIAGRIDCELFKRQVTVFTGNTGVVLPPFQNGTDEDLRLGSLNLVHVGLSASALTTDETLDEVFGELFADVDSNRTAIRVMVKQLRNAFAHNPWRPKWRVAAKYRHAYPIVLNETSGSESFGFSDPGQINDAQTSSTRFFAASYTA